MFLYSVMQAFQLNFQEFCFSLWISIHVFSPMEAYLIVSLDDSLSLKGKKWMIWYSYSMTKHLDF